MSQSGTEYDQNSLPRHQVREYQDNMTLLTDNSVNLSTHLEQFKEQGYTIFEQVYEPEVMAAWKLKFKQLQDDVVNAAHHAPWWFGNMLEHAPRLMLPAITRPVLWDFAELVMGPFVQLDNLTLVGFPSTTEAESQGKISGWHRDRYAGVPRGEAYQRPLSINLISYLQDLTPEYGPLRVIAGSHRRAITLEPEARTRPHPEETVVEMKAGDVVVIHNSLIHSGTPNISGQTRYFFSIYLNLTWLKHTDNLSGPSVQEIAKHARERNDHRLLRLLGIDDQREARANSGFMRPDEQLWAEWAAQDKAGVVVP